LASVQAELDRLGKVEATLTGLGDNGLLLGYDPAGDGKAIVAVGNPDTAAHTAVWVPGLNTELADIQGNTNRVRHLQERADELTLEAAGDVAAVMWLGYDAPETGSSVLAHGRSEQGGKALDSFVDGLHVTNDGQGHTVTAIGHSYGSTVVAEAALRGDGLAVNDIVVAGSPGMHTDHAADLNIDPRHVWAGSAPLDPVSDPGDHPAAAAAGMAPGAGRRPGLRARRGGGPGARGQPTRARVRREPVPCGHHRAQRLLEDRQRKPGQPGPHCGRQVPRCELRPRESTSMRPIPIIGYFIVLVMLGGCTGGGGNDVDIIKQVSPAEATRIAYEYADRVVALTGGERGPANREPHTGPCEGRRGEFSERVYYAYFNFHVAPIPEDQQLPTLRRLREHWQQQGYTIKRDRVFPDSRTGELAVENPADGYEVSLEGTEPPTAFAVSVSSPCYQPDEPYAPPPRR
jgi:pimeloyl-ACP methyl ester carboxylesterase